MNIQTKFIAPIISLSVIFCAAAASAFAQDVPPPKTKQSSVLTPEKQREIMKHVKPMPSGTNFTIEAVSGPYIQYTILLSDAESHTLTGNFVRPQIDIFEALLQAAKDFALTDEEAGTKAQPKVTRFMDKNEKGIIIDVQKAGPISHFYLTMQSLFGKMTIDAGTIERVKPIAGKEPPEPLFYKIISRVQEAKNTTPMPAQIQQ
jgi:hypothetical protein